MVDFGKMLEQVRSRKSFNEKNAMSATQAQQEILSLMSRYAGNFAQTKGKKNPFGAIKVPPGSYCWQLVRMALIVSQPAGKPKQPGIQFSYVCQSDMDGDLTWKGEQVRVSRKLGATEKQDDQETVDRLIYDLQDLGVNTDDLEPFNANPPDGKFNLLQLCSFMTGMGMYLRGEIAESPNPKGGTYKNLNLRGRLSDEELELLLGPGNYTPSGDGSGEVDSGALANAEVTDTSSPDDQAYADADYEADGGEEEAGDGPYELEDGTPCDKWGNPVGTVYDDVPVEQAAPTPPAPPAPVAKPAPVQRAAAPVKAAQPAPAKAAPARTPAAQPAQPAVQQQPVGRSTGAGAPKRVGPPKRP